MRVRLILLLLALPLAAPGIAEAASTILLINEDGPGEGLNDPTAITPAGANPGQTLGEARRIAIEFAAAIWAEQLDSEVPIYLAMDFRSLGGSATMATLGRGGAGAVYRDFAGAPRPATWYVSALADRLAGVDLGGETPDVRVIFNADVDTDLALGSSRFYYGLDGAPPDADAEFVAVVLHEIAHGLGFNTFVDPQTGEKLLGYDDSYLLHLERHGAIPPHLAAMSDADRAQALLAEPDLHWIGTAALSATGALETGLGPDGHIEMYAPSGATGGAATHFASSLFPDDFMEPFYSPESVRFGLVLGVLEDTGWGTAASCEEGVLP